MFVDSITDAELRFVVLHECYHKLYRHLITWRHLHDIDPIRANMACDYVINIKIADDNTDGFAVMPKGCCYNVKYRGWDSAAVFNDLPENNSPDGEGGEPGDDAETGFDEHDWHGAGNSPTRYVSLSVTLTRRYARVRLLLVS